MDRDGCEPVRSDRSILERVKETILSGGDPGERDEDPAGPGVPAGAP